MFSVFGSCFSSSLSLSSAKVSPASRQEGGPSETSDEEIKKLYETLIHFKFKNKFSDHKRKI